MKKQASIPQFGNVPLGLILAGDESNEFMRLSGVHFDVTSRLFVRSTTPFIGLFASLSITLETSVDLE